MTEYTTQTLADELNLPAWTHTYPEVVARCATDLAYRCNVCSAAHDDYRHVLIREAQRWASWRNLMDRDS